MGPRAGAGRDVPDERVGRVSRPRRRYDATDALPRHHRRRSRSAAPLLSCDVRSGPGRPRCPAFRRRSCCRHGRYPRASPRVQRSRCVVRASPAPARRRVVLQGPAAGSSTRAVSAGDFLARLTALLDTAKIPYMIAGSFASTFHGVARATQDLDLVIDPTGSALETFLSSLDPSSRETQLSFGSVLRSGSRSLLPGRLQGNCSLNRNTAAAWLPNGIRREDVTSTRSNPTWPLQVLEMVDHSGLHRRACVARSGRLRRRRTASYGSGWRAADS